MSDKDIIDIIDEFFNDEYSSEFHTELARHWPTISARLKAAEAGLEIAIQALNNIIADHEPFAKTYAKEALKKMRGEKA